MDLPDGFGSLEEVQRTIQNYQAGRALAPEYNDHFDGLSTWLQESIPNWAAWEESVLVNARKRQDEAQAEFTAFFTDIGVDALLVPAAVGEAPVGLHDTGGSLFTRAWVVLHGPEVTIPGLTGEAGMPMGVQLVGPHGSDAHVLAVSAWLHGVIA